MSPSSGSTQHNYPLFKEHRYPQYFFEDCICLKDCGSGSTRQLQLITVLPFSQYFDYLKRQLLRAIFGRFVEAFVDRGCHSSPSL